MTEKSKPPKREYPAVYEKIVPISLGILALVVIGMLVFTVLVATGLLTFG